MKLSPKTTPVELADLLIRFHNMVGAAVDFTGRHSDFRWRCHACNQNDDHPYLEVTRQYANQHAAECRAAYHRFTSRS
ncbi:hypothetical protein ACM614_23615 [Streptomyces sp. 12297]